MRATVAAAVLVLAVIVPVLPAAAADPDPPRALPANATANDLKWQPSIDFDADGCYNVPAIGPDGTIAEGLPHDRTTGPAGCHDKSDLDNTNVYSRQRCNSGWCVYLYDYYFEKDVGVENVADAGGHTHDWEHIAVWVQNNQRKFVSASQHGKYVVKPAEDVRWDGDTHPQMVYHKDESVLTISSTHDFRFATAGDEPPENYYHAWQRGTLVSYEGFPDGLREKLFDHNFDHASMAISKAKFVSELEKAIPKTSDLECEPNGVGGQTCEYVDTPQFTFLYDQDADGSPGNPNTSVPTPTPTPTPTPPPGPNPNPAGPIKVMVVGDSMSQGRAGDWTWRYRLWEWFRAQHVDVDFVGPFFGTKPAGVPGPPGRPPLQGNVTTTVRTTDTSGPYASEARRFDSSHFALWGRQVAQAKGLIREQVATYHPDLLLVGLGFNDMGWFISGPEETNRSMKTLVDEARAAKPDIKFALANVPQRTLIGGREDLPVKTDSYNKLLAASIPSWRTAKSPVELVDWRGNYSCELHDCPAGYDGLHPNSLGEYQIAQAFERTLHDKYHLGSDVPAFPTPPDRPTPVPSNVRADSTPSGVTVTWDAVFGALGYTVRYRIPGITDWTEVGAGANRYDTTWTVDGIHWEYQVRTDSGVQNGRQLRSDWSPIVSAVAHPQTVGAPPGIVTHATATGVDVVWGPPSGPYTDTIDRYQIITWDQDIPGSWIGGTAVKGLSVHIDDLIPGHHYIIAMATWNAAGGGLPGFARSVTIGAGTPPAPKNLRVTSVDDTSVQLTWRGSNEAAGYRVWTRNINDGSKSSAAESIITNTSHGIGFLFPGVWNYEFCATAINGAAESSKSNCVVAPRPAGSAARSSTSSAEPPAARQAPASPAPSTSITKVTDLTKLSQSMAPSGVTAAESKELAIAP